MGKIYFNNAATTFPKPKGVAEAVYNYIMYNGSNIARGADMSGMSAQKAVYETRSSLADFFNFNKPENVIFTSGVTESLNMVIKGMLKDGNHVLVSSLEHNAVMRPLNQMVKNGVTFDRIPCDKCGRMLWNDDLIKENTTAVIINHASNVCGTIVPIEEIGKVCRKRGLKLIVDAAQSAGCIKIDMEKMNIDALCFTGHKGLFGPQGIGGVILTDDMAEMIEPIISGGTGSMSDSENIPDFMPDKFEGGTKNIPGIYGLREGIKFINEVGIENIHSKEMKLVEKFIAGVKNIDGFKIAGIQETDGRTAVVSLYGNRDMAEIAFELEKNYGIVTRVGLHCSPNSHKALGTFPNGTIRFSFGYFNTEEEIEIALAALKNI